MRDVGKELRNLQLALMESDDKPIYYISKIYGHKYIVPRSEFEKLQRENIIMKKVLGIIKEKYVDIYLLKSINTLEEYNKNIGLRGIELTQEDFNTLKRWVENE